MLQLFVPVALADAPSSLAIRHLLHTEGSPPPAELDDRIRRAQAPIPLLVLLDARAWEATDRVAEAGRVDEVGGWVTAREGDELVTHFFTDPNKLREVCRVVFRGDDTRGVAECPKKPSKVGDDPLIRSYRARQAVIADPRFIPRVDRYNVEVLVDDDGGWFVFLLPAMMDASRIPVLGAWRGHVRADGVVDALDPLSEGALFVPAPSAEGAMFTLHVLDDIPNEGVLFASARYGLTFLATSPVGLWRVDQGNAVWLGGDDPQTRWARSLYAAVTAPSEVSLGFLGDDLQPEGEARQVRAGPLPAEDLAPHNGWMHSTSGHPEHFGAGDYGGLLLRPEAVDFLAGGRTQMVSAAQVEGGTKVTLYTTIDDARTLHLVGTHGPFGRVVGPAPASPPSACPTATLPPLDASAPLGDPTEDWLGYWGEAPLTARPEGETWRLFQYGTQTPWRMVRVDLAKDGTAHAVVRSAAALAPPLALGELLGQAPPAVQTRELDLDATALAWLRDRVEDVLGFVAQPHATCPGVDGVRWVLEHATTDGVQTWAADEPGADDPTRGIGTALLVASGEDAG
ncbi:MAG: hypothetical protein H6738_25255 [Alphaproteobacteria bacterium]|nr:hypothetical protein [Alphaproteobacteria bacterium]MCB9700121.1 hypothetical protein [Alphaproteobacteria bacterium]